MFTLVRNRVDREQASASKDCGILAHAGNIAASSSEDEFDNIRQIMLNFKRKSLLQFVSGLARVEQHKQRIMLVSELEQGLFTKVVPCPINLSRRIRSSFGNLSFPA